MKCDKCQKQATYSRKYYKTVQFYEFVERVWEKQIGENKREINDSTVDQKSELWQYRWKEICELGEKENFKVIITLQPILGAGNKVLTDWEIRAAEDYGHINPSISYNFMRDKLNELETSCAGTEDLTNVFDNETDLIYFDVGHMGDKGNRIIAEKMFKISSPFVTDIQE